MTPLTGTDIAVMQDACNRHDVSYYTVDSLTTAPYVIDVGRRAIYLAGYLPVERFFKALCEALTRLVGWLTGSNVVALRPGMAAHAGTG